MKKIVLIFAGREEYMEVLLAHLAKQRTAFDELHICENARTIKDAAFIKQYAAANPDVKLIPRTNYSLGYLDFYNQLDRDNVYLKLDDDIMYISDGAIGTMFAQRLADTASLLISGNIINSDNKADANPVHDAFIASAKAGSEDTYKTANEEIPGGRFAINAVSFFAKDIPIFTSYQSDEVVLTTILPSQLNKVSALCGSALFVHYSFATQGVKYTFLKGYRGLAGLS